MTRKDYVKFAEGFRSGKPQQNEGAEILRGFELARDIVIDILAADNPRFDRERFYRACEPRPAEPVKHAKLKKEAWPFEPTCVLCELEEEPGHEH